MIVMNMKYTYNSGFEDVQNVLAMEVPSPLLDMQARLRKEIDKQLRKRTEDMKIINSE